MFKPFTHRRFLRLAVAGLGVLLVTSPLHAHQGATGVVKERMDRMQAMKRSVKTLGAMAKGETPFDQGEVKTAASQLRHAAVDLPATFPEGSLAHPSEATPRIWQEWTQFVRYATRLEQVAVRLEQQSEQLQMPQFKREFVMVARACRGCHTKYRHKKSDAMTMQPVAGE